MQIRRVLLATTAVLSAGVASPPLLHAQIGVQQERNAPNVYAITNAHIVPVSGPAIDRGTIVIRNGLIAAVGSSVRVPADASVIDGTGLSVYPGLIAAYSTLGVQADVPERGGGRGGAPNGSGPAQRNAAPSVDPAPNSLHPEGLRPEVSVVDLLHDDGDFAAAQAAGFTTALTAPASGIFVGQSAVISLRDGDVQDILIKSPIAMHIAFQTARRGFDRREYPGSLMGVFAALRQMLLDAQRYGTLQATYAASSRGMPRPEHDPSLAALQPVLSRQMPVIMEANSQREIERALDLAKEFNLRAMIVGGAEAGKVAARLKAEHVPVLLSADFPRRPPAAGPDADPEPLRVLRARVEAPKQPAQLAQAGVTFAFEPGNGYTRFLTNVQRAVEDGLSPDAALRAMTLTPAELFGVSDRLGSIEVGKIASLTITRGDLFDRSARVTQLFVDGRPVEVHAPTAAAGEAVTAAGTWTVTVTLDEGDKPVTIALQQDGAVLSGTLQGALGSAQIANGSISADGDVRFTASVTMASGTEEATFSGTLTGNTIRGTVQIVGHSQGTFVGTRPNQGVRPRRGRTPQR